MFEDAEYGPKITKKDYNAQVAEIRTNLLQVQNDLKTAGFPVLIIIGGVDGGGKGETVNLLNEWMDPRFIDTHAFSRTPSEEEKERPEFWRYWREMPQKGKIGIFVSSWYSKPILSTAYGLSSEDDLADSIVRINTLEKELSDDGMLIIKFWFHLSKKAQKKRLKKLDKDPETRWRVTETDWKHYLMYKRFSDICWQLVSQTSTQCSPWTILNGENDRYRNLMVGRAVLEKLTATLQKVQAEKENPTKKPARRPKFKAEDVLGKLDMTKTVEGDNGKKELQVLQGTLNMLNRKAKGQGKSTILLFEGVDAAGKGGVIRRIAAALNAPDYTIIPIAAPSDEEKAHHYLWRFWRHMPRAGRLTIFDRTWYGRVLVERVEGFAKPDEWSRAYAEINDFEQQLVEHDILLLKFWLHIDKDEQLRRFQARENVSFKQFKITDEDWRNREKWDDYVIAVNDMVRLTSTGYAPWAIVPANDKRYARAHVLKTICERLKDALE